MPVPNPEYNPDWREIYDVHDAERSRLDEVISEYYKKGRYGVELQDAEKARDKHHEACLDCYRMQFPTVQEHAEWVFKNFDVASRYGEKFPVEVPDFEEFKTLDDVSSAWARVHEAQEYAYALKHYSLPAGQPEGLTAFSDKKNLLIYSRTFEVQAWGHNKVTTIIIADQKDGVSHVCFTHDHASLGPSVTNRIEDLATHIYQEAVVLAKQQAEAMQLEHSVSKAGFNLFDLFRRKTEKQHSDLVPKPTDFNFYIHIPPSRGMLGEERFSKVKMTFDGHSYISPQWEHFDIIPEAIQTARFEIMKSAKPPLPVFLAGNNL